MGVFRKKSVKNRKKGMYKFYRFTSGLIILREMRSEDAIGIYKVSPQVSGSAGSSGRSVVAEKRKIRMIGRSEVTEKP
jgi:hypothetical protein